MKDKMRPGQIHLIPDKEGRSRKLAGNNLEIITNMENSIYGEYVQQAIGSSESSYNNPVSVSVPSYAQSCDATARFHSSGQVVLPKKNEK